MPLELSTVTTGHQLTLEGLNEEIYKKRLRRRVERYILKDPGLEQNPLQYWRLHGTDLEPSVQIAVNIPFDWVVDCSWVVTGCLTSNARHTRYGAYILHPKVCPCDLCAELLEGAVYAQQDGSWFAAELTRQKGSIEARFVDRIQHCDI